MPQFVDIPVGTKFKFENQEYIKTADERITCCKVMNAHLASDPKQKTMIVPISEVEVIQE